MGRGTNEVRSALPSARDPEDEELRAVHARLRASPIAAIAEDIGLDLIDLQSLDALIEWSHALGEVSALVEAIPHNGRCPAAHDPGAACHCVRGGMLRGLYQMSDRINLSVALQRPAWAVQGDRRTLSDMQADPYALGLSWVRPGGQLAAALQRLEQALERRERAASGETPA